MKNNNGFTLEVTGEAMAPSILEGDTVYINPEDFPRPNGKDVAVLKVNGQYHICRYTKFGKQFLLMHDNAPISAVFNGQVEIVGKVIDGTFNIKKENLSAENTKAFAY